ncbi:MAG: helicase-related protein, partial [Verrucomicrobiia bacterium]
SEETVKRYYGDRISELEMLLAEEKAKQGGGDKGTTRDLETAIKGLRKRFDRILAWLKESSDKNIPFEKTGIDALLIDEAHAYKRAPIVTRMQRIKGIPNGESARAMDLMMKVRHVQEKMKGRNVILATGTPVTNTFAEVYVMMNIIAPKVLEGYGIHSFDDFAATFAIKEDKTEYTWAGTWKRITRMARFVNGRVLSTMIRNVFDVKMGNKELGLDVPDIEGGKPEEVIVEQTPANEAWSRMLDEIAANYMSLQGKEKKTFSYIPILTMQTGMAAALDPRLVDPQAPDHKGSKVNKAVDRILSIWKEGAERKSTQIVFADRFANMDTEKLGAFVHGNLSLSAEDEEKGTEEEGADEGGDEEKSALSKREDEEYKNAKFNLYHDIKNKLIALGVPEKEIAIIHDYKASKKRDKLFEDMNAGNVRILLGSTEKLGIGVNVQERLAAVHHLDPPRMMTPAMDEQRNGRIIRQGNMHAAKVGDQDGWNIPVKILRYGTANSMDTGIYQMLETKSKAVVQALKGQMSEDEFDDPADEVTRSFAVMKALSTGDTRVLRNVELEDTIRKLRLSREGFLNERGAAVRKLGDFRLAV